MMVEAGHFALILALTVALAQAAIPFWGARIGEPRLMEVATPAALCQFLLVLYAFAALIAAYVQSDFSVINVFQNSHSAKPLIYKIAGTWGNHEGSMVLWVLILAFFGALVVLFGGNLPLRLKANALAVQGLISFAFLLFILATSNPFLRLDPAPYEGVGLNPILQDPALAIHPPLLYLGYVGLSMAYSFAIAALIEGKVDAAWARWVRPWTLAAWVFLTLGIAIGSWWAYYELGWGGWWFWDPVENASFMPWLAATALLHSAVVMEKRDSLKVWTVLLAVLAFGLSLLGAFLVRSGVLTSVHSFATDPARGVFILAIMALFAGGGFALFAWRAPLLRQGGPFAQVSRETSLVLNNFLLSICCGVVFVGTLYPLALEAVADEKISVGPPFFDAAFTPFALLLLFLAPIGPLLAWKRGDLAAALRRLAPAALVAAAVAVAVASFYARGPWLALVAVAAGVWMIGGAIIELATRSRFFEVAFREGWDRLRRLPRSNFGAALAHLGLGVAVIGMAGVSAWKSETIQAMKPGDTLTIAGYEVRFEGAFETRGPNYDEIVGRFAISSGGDSLGMLEPSKRNYTAPRSQTTEAGIRNALGGDLYIVLGDAAGDGALAVRAYFHPLVRLIWAGAFIMALGGALSLTDRRLRVGAPARGKAKSTRVVGAG